MEYKGRRARAEREEEGDRERKYGWMLDYTDRDGPPKGWKTRQREVG